MKRLLKMGSPFEWILFLLWAVFVNAVNVWIIEPLAADYAVLGVLAILVIVGIWLVSIPQRFRKRWITFTVFALLLGQGLSSIAYYPLSTRIPLGLIMVLGLFILGWAVSRARFLSMILSTAAIFAANALLPISQWPFLTHFDVMNAGRISLIPSDMPSAPLSVISTSTGQAIVSLNNVRPNKAELAQLVSQATNTPNALRNLLFTQQDEYQFVKIDEENGHIVTTSLTDGDYARVNPLALTSAVFPFSVPQWVLINGQPAEFMIPSKSTASATSFALGSAMYPVSGLAWGETTKTAVLSGWDNLLSQMMIQPVASPLEIVNHHLTGTAYGHPISLSVNAVSIVGEGSFTAPGRQQLLLEGADRLQVVDVTATSSRVVANYSSSPDEPLPSDIVIGPLVKGGADAIFINSSPAYILTVNGNGTMTKVYQAPSPSFRFETVETFAGDKSPEIITDDPSYIRDVATRYFTSYTYNHGTLERNWRVYHTNVVNVHPVQFVRGGTTYLVVGIYATGTFLILNRSFVPVLPLAIGLLGLSVLIGFVMRLKDRRKRGQAHA